MVPANLLCGALLVLRVRARLDADYVHLALMPGSGAAEYDCLRICIYIEDCQVFLNSK